MHGQRGKRNRSRHCFDRTGLSELGTRTRCVIVAIHGRIEQRQILVTQHDVGVVVELRSWRKRHERIREHHLLLGSGE